MQRRKLKTRFLKQDINGTMELMWLYDCVPSYFDKRIYHTSELSFLLFSFENKENKFDVKIDNYLYITVVFCLIKALLLGLLNSHSTNSWKVKIQFERSRKMTIFIIWKSSFCLTHFPEKYNFHFFFKYLNVMALHFQTDADALNVLIWFPVFCLC